MPQVVANRGTFLKMYVGVCPPPPPIPQYEEEPLTYSDQVCQSRT